MPADAVLARRAALDAGEDFHGQIETKSIELRGGAVELTTRNEGRTRPPNSHPVRGARRRRLEGRRVSIRSRHRGPSAPGIEPDLSQIVKDEDQKTLLTIGANHSHFNVGASHRCFHDWKLQSPRLSHVRRAGVWHGYAADPWSVTRAGSGCSSPATQADSPIRRAVAAARPEQGAPWRSFHTYGGRAASGDHHVRLCLGKLLRSARVCTERGRSDGATGRAHSRGLR